jgi:hypothetical protein
MILKLIAQGIGRALGRYGGDSACAEGRGRCMDFPSTNTTVTDFLEWFQMEV